MRAMGLCIGVDYGPGSWKTCLMENGGVIDLCSFATPTALHSYLEGICARYPEPLITLALCSGAPLAPLRSLTDQQLTEMTLGLRDPQQCAELKQFLINVGLLNLNSYSLPAIRHLPGVPAYRKFVRFDLGSSQKLCSTVTLLQRLREREAAWSEMSFLYLEANRCSRSILVIENGHITNGIGDLEGSQDRALSATTADGQQSVLAADQQADLDTMEQAFWERLTQDLAGLTAIHHIEDIVVAGQRQDEVIERLGDLYQLYFFPRSEALPAEFEAAFGAALIADGLHHPGTASEVLEHLQIHNL